MPAIIDYTLNSHLNQYGHHRGNFMKQIIFMTLLLIGTSLQLTPLVNAQSLRTIQLEDGSIIKGKVVGLQNGQYHIETTNLGVIQIAENKIVSISNDTPTTSTISNDEVLNNPNMLKAQVGSLQQTLFSDPNAIMEIQKVFENPELKAILSDPKFVQDIMSYDINKIQGNANTQKLMNNPDIQKLMQQLQGSLGK